MTFITVKGASPDSDIPEGVYPVALTAIADPRTVTAQRGVNAGKDIDLIDWTFIVIDGPAEGKEIQASTSTASGPRSKMFAYLTALLGGRSPAVGQQFTKEDLVGKAALATVGRDEGGWPRIENLGAIPVSMLGQQVAKQTGAPQQPAPQAVAPQPVTATADAAVATADDALPF